ncbi:MAG: AraC family transcriptional regulator [Candidatus Binatia bacterium]
MKKHATLGGIHVLDLLDALGGLGVETRTLWQGVSQDHNALPEPDERVPVELVTGLFAEAERRTGDPFVGLHAGQRAQSRGPLDYLFLSSPRLAEGIRYVERFARLILDTFRIRLEVQDDTASVVFEPGDRTFGSSRHAVEYMLMACLRSMRRALGDEFGPCEVHVRHGRRRDQAEVARAFGCRVEFGQADNRMVLPPHALDTTSHFANPLIAEQIEKFAAVLAARTAPRETHRERVADVTRMLLAAGMPADAGTVAHRLHVSARTLQRNLEREHTTFRAVRDTVLWEVVEALLSNPSIKFEAVALSVGFADGAAFSKAFRRWAGCSPTHHRARLLARAARQLRASRGAR